MPEVLHPRVIIDEDWDPPAVVSIGRSHYDVTDGVVALASEREAERLAEAYDVSRDAITLDAQTDSGTCQAVKTDGDVCGRELPCPYHSETEDA